MDWSRIQTKKNLLRQSMQFEPLCFKSLGGLLLSLMPGFICLLAEDCSLMKKGAERGPSTLKNENQGRIIKKQAKKFSK